jgi:oxygen-independent coproporphyrinogen-3 oxidase
MSIKTLAIYIHWPFCASKCPYCDFNSHVAATIDHDAWARAYLREIDHYAELMPGRQVTSVFFGGGTPSLMKPEAVELILSHIQKKWHISNQIEMTLEANPTSIEIDKFQAFKSAGVNRVSVGVQALKDEDLKFLGRAHSAEDARRAIEIAQSVFDRSSFDLMYARPGQTVSGWIHELQDALNIMAGHVSLYQLTIESGTPFFTSYARGEFTIPDSDLAADLYEATQDVMGASGRPAYEISNHAKPGEESRHNLSYWLYQDYVGIGPGAHGRLTLDGIKHATRAHRAPDIWLGRVHEQGHGAHPFEPISREGRFAEALMMGLRLTQGVELSRLTEEGGKSWQDKISTDKITSLIEEGLILSPQTHLQATQKGRACLNAVLSYLL